MKFKLLLPLLIVTLLITAVYYKTNDLFQPYELKYISAYNQNRTIIRYDQVKQFGIVISSTKSDEAKFIMENMELVTTPEEKSAALDIHSSGQTFGIEISAGEVIMDFIINDSSNYAFDIDGNNVYKISDDLKQFIINKFNEN